MVSGGPFVDGFGVFDGGVGAPAVSYFLGVGEVVVADFDGVADGLGADVFSWFFPGVVE
jgi:hypothetical protein